MQFTEPVFRAPQEAHALLVRGTQGCTHNKCNFCYMSRGHRYGAATPEQFEEEVSFQKVAYPADTRVYIVGSDTFSLPTAKLIAYAEIIRRHIPAFVEISIQGRLTGAQRKSNDELRSLSDAGIKHLYIGMESGDEEALRIMNKGITAAETLEQMRRLDESGIEYTAQCILGLTGRGHARTSGIASANLLNRVHPRRIMTTGLTVFPTAPLSEMVRNGTFVEASEKEKVEELLIFLERLTVDTILDATHVLNPVHFTLRTRQDKNGILTELRNFLASHSEEEIERMVNRQAMSSI